MEVDVKNIRKDIEDLNKLIVDYENNILNTKKILSDINGLWYGDKATNFLDKVTIEQRKVYNNILEIKSLIAVYEYIANEYGCIGKVIKFDLKKRIEVYNYFDNLIKLVKEILLLYNNIPIKYLHLVQNHKCYFPNLIASLNHVKNSYSSTIDKINNIEAITKINISKISIEILKENDIKDLM